MTKDDILQMAFDAEFVVSGNLVLVSGYGGYVGITDKLTSFAALVVAKAAAEENEACAKIAATISDKYAYGYYGNEFDTADEIYDEIRARHSTQKEKS